MRRGNAEVIDLKEEHLLLLYALKRQAVDGPCKDPKPWGWNGEESTKWHAWSSLGNMSGVEAMRLYVRTLEEEMVHNEPPPPLPALPPPLRKCSHAYIR